MTTDTNRMGWSTVAILVGRLIFAAVFTHGGKFQADGYQYNGGLYRGARVFPWPSFWRGSRHCSNSRLSRVF